MSQTNFTPRKAAYGAFPRQARPRPDARNAQTAPAEEGNTTQTARVIALGMAGDGQINIKDKDKGGGLLWDADNDGYAEATNWVDGKTAVLMADVDGDGIFSSSPINLASDPFRTSCIPAEIRACAKVIATDVVNVWTESRFGSKNCRNCFSQGRRGAPSRIRSAHQLSNKRIEEQINEK